jgi:hypothetical protein
VTVVAQRPAKDYARESDTPPYYGGGLVFGRGGACSSGFAGYNPRRNIEYLLTAAHCGGLNSDFTDGNGEVIGTVVGENGEYDTSFIETRSAPQVFDGPPVFVSGQFIKPVRGAMHTVDGDWVCVSGATTGAVCGIQVDNAHIFDCSDQEMGCVRLIGGLSRTNPVQLVFGDGDSGGPVFSLTDNDTADVARGLVKGSYGTVLGNCNDPLNGHYPGHSRTRTCSTGLTFTDVLSAASPFDIRIQTELG